MSLGHLQQHYQHPLLAAISGNNYAAGQPQRSFNAGHAMGPPQRPMNFQQQQRPLLAAGTNVNGVYYGSSGGGGGHSGSGHSGPGHSSGYGSYEPSSPSGDYHSGPPAYAPPSGGSYSHHSAAHGGSNYGPPPHPPAHHPPHPPAHPPPHPPHPPPPPPSSKKFKPKKGGSSAMSALTLLALFFFMNLLQSCLKEHMDTVNPTVMVLNSGVVRNRFNKLAEMNSREQQSPATARPKAPVATAAPVVTPTVILQQPAPIVVAPSQMPPPPPMSAIPAVTVGQQHEGSHYGQAPPAIASNGPLPNTYHIPHPHSPPAQRPAYVVSVIEDPLPEYYDDAGHSPYPNHTTNAYHSHQHHHQQQQQQHNSHVHQQSPLHNYPPAHSHDYEQRPHAASPSSSSFSSSSHHLASPSSPSSYYGDGDDAHYSPFQHQHSHRPTNTGSQYHHRPHARF